MPPSKVRTTVAIPEDLLRSVDEAVRAGSARSRNDFLTSALENQLAASRREAMDAAFAEMADDPLYEREALEIVAEFQAADDEALRIAEGRD